MFFGVEKDEYLVSTSGGSSLGTRQSLSTEGPTGFGKSPVTPAATHQRDAPYNAALVVPKRVSAIELLIPTMIGSTEKRLPKSGTAKTFGGE